jgi:hypothetical protein
MNSEELINGNERDISQKKNLDSTQITDLLTTSKITPGHDYLEFWQTMERLFTSGTCTTHKQP